MPEKPTPVMRSSSAQAYDLVVKSYVTGMGNAWASGVSRKTLDIIRHRLKIMHLEGELEIDLENPIHKELVSLDDLECMAGEYVGNFGQLVYGSSVFDTFLADTTKFLFLLFPSSIGSTKAVTVNDIVLATSTADLLCDAVNQRVLEIGYKSILERVRFLETTYKLETGISQTTRDRLDRFWVLRSTAVHDQGAVELSRDGDNVKGELRACPFTPQPLSYDEFKAAVNTYTETAMRLASVIYSSVLREPKPSFIEEVEDLGYRLAKEGET